MKTKDLIRKLGDLIDKERKSKRTSEYIAETVLWYLQEEGARFTENLYEED